MRFVKENQVMNEISHQVKFSQRSTQDSDVGRIADFDGFKRIIILVYDNEQTQEAERIQTFITNFGRKNEIEFEFKSVHDHIGETLTTWAEENVPEAYKIIAIFSKERMAPGSSQTPIIMNQAVVDVLTTQRSDRLICVALADIRKDLPEEYRIGAFMKPGHYKTLKCYLLTSTNLSLRGRLEMHNVGYCMAMGFYCGFIDFIFGCLRKTMEKTSFWKRKRLSKKIYLLMPKSFRMPDEGFCDGGRISHVAEEPEVDRVEVDRGGVHARVYRYNGCKVIDSQGEDYYAHVEYPTPLTSLTKMYISQLFVEGTSNQASEEERLKEMSPKIREILRGGMDNFMWLLKRIDVKDWIRFVEYDDEAADWTPDKLADQLAEAIKEDVRKADLTDDDLNKMEVEEVSTTGAQSDCVYDVTILTPSPSAERDMAPVFEVLKKLESDYEAVKPSKTVFWAHEPEIGTNKLDQIAKGIENSNQYILVASRSDFSNTDGNGNGNHFRTCLAAALAKIRLSNGVVNLTVVTDCAEISDISSSLNVCFIKQILWEKDHSQDTLLVKVKEALKADRIVPAIRYLNMGRVLATEYFYSYLKYKLPFIPNVYDEGDPGWIYDGAEIPKKVFIILNLSGDIKFKPTDESESIDVVTEHEPRNVVQMRGGAKRDYKSTLYRIKHDGKKYYAIMEYIASVQSIVNVCKKYNLGERWLKDETECFHETLMTILRHESNKDFSDLCTVIFYDGNIHQRLNEKLAAVVGGYEVTVPMDAPPTPPGDSLTSMDPNYPSQTSHSGDDTLSEGEVCDANSTYSSDNRSIAANKGHVSADVTAPVERVVNPNVDDDTREHVRRYEEHSEKKNFAAPCTDQLTNAHFTHSLHNGHSKDSPLNGKSTVIHHNGQSLDSLQNGQSLDCLRYGNASVPRELSNGHRRSVHRMKTASIDSLDSTDIQNRTWESLPSLTTDDEFFDASEGNRTYTSSIGDESCYQSVLGDTSTAYFSDSEHSDLSTLSPDEDTPNTTHSMVTNNSTEPFLLSRSDSCINAPERHSTPLFTSRPDSFASFSITSPIMPAVSEKSVPYVGSMSSHCSGSSAPCLSCSSDFAASSTAASRSTELSGLDLSGAEVGELSTAEVVHHHRPESETTVLMSDDSPISSLEPLPSVRLHDDGEEISPRSRLWRGTRAGNNLEQKEQTPYRRRSRTRMSSRLVEASSTVIRGVTEEVVQLLGREIVNYVDSVQLSLNT